ncbi:hypothetical protein AB1Y20_006229 [Prymnesium parvum]|uniref:PNPLA domain-containing protein n=1 Tax=Prymnesium parvum TaxID=97485 RepID=A0AB34J479_PRYPA
MLLAALHLLALWSTSPLALLAALLAAMCGLCFLFGSHRALRWPLLLLFGLCALVVSSAMVLLHCAMLAWEGAMRRAHPVHRKCSRLDKCAEEEAWLHEARELDARLPKASAFLQDEAHPQYNHAQVRATLLALRLEREALERGGTTAPLLRLLGSCVRTNFCGIDNEELYAQTHAGTNPLIEAYVHEVVLCLDAAGAAARRDAAAAAAVRSFLRRSARSFGRTGLILSGGGMLCNYHWGIVMGLLDQGLLPSCLCGTSAGAAVAALFASHTPAELEDVLQPHKIAALLALFNDATIGPWRTVLHRFWNHGHIGVSETWTKMIQELCNHSVVPHITFEEAYRRTGREVCITVTPRRRHEPPVLLNRHVSPDVTLWSAVRASVALPFLLPAQPLVVKLPSAAVQVLDATTSMWRDGSILGDTPRVMLGQQFGVSYCMVSQVNPHANLGLRISTRPQAGKPSPSHFARGRDGWRGGFVMSVLLSWLLLEGVKWMQLIAELALLPQLFDADWSWLLLQPYSGEATFVPPLTLRDYTRALSDPSEDDIERCIRVGRQEVWRKSGMLSTRLRLAQALQKLEDSLCRTTGSFYPEAAGGEASPPWWQRCASTLAGRRPSAAQLWHPRDDVGSCFL